MKERKNLFECLNLPARFDINSELLEKKYFLAIAKSHPDQLLSNHESQKHTVSASLINEAYQVLSEPLKRARYLLTLKGIEVSENINNSNSNGAFLMEKMSLYEKLDLINQNKSDNLAINQFKNQLHEKLGQNYADFQKLFDSNDLDEILEKITACQFYQQILQKAESLSTDSITINHPKQTISAKTTQK